MIAKHPLCPERVRRPPREGFSWIDRRFLRVHAKRLAPEAILLYLFLAAVSDRFGLSFYSDATVAAVLKMEQAPVPDRPKRASLLDPYRAHRRTYRRAPGVVRGARHGGDRPPRIRGRSEFGAALLASHPAGAVARVSGSDLGAGRGDASGLGRLRIDPDRPEHAPRLRVRRRVQSRQIDHEFDSLGAEAREFHLQLLRRPVKASVHVRRLLGLARLYGRTELLDAIRFAVQYQTYDAAYVETLLHQQRRRQLPSPVPLCPRRRELIDEITLDEPDPAAYDRLFQLPDLENP